MLKNAVIVSSMAAALQISIASSAQAAAASGTLGGLGPSLSTRALWRARSLRLEP